MIVCRTPFRISFFGGGTDYPAWFTREGGAVLSTTIDKYCYLSCRFLPPFFNIKHRVVWSHVETVSSVSEILHPAVREGMRMLGFDDHLGLEIHHQADLPARAGMGSSSAFAVGLIKALTALRGADLSAAELAQQAIRLEQDVLRENVGCQDQVATAFGGLNVIRFNRDGSFEVEPIPVALARLQELQSRLLLVYSGTSRLATNVAAGFVNGLSSRERELRRMRELVDHGVAVLTGAGPLDDFGALLHEGWALKQSLASSVTSPVVDRIYRRAIAAGALGGKLLGAGGSGFLVFYTPPERREAVIEALGDFLTVPFAFDRIGSTIIYNGSTSAAAMPALEYSLTHPRSGPAGS